MPERIEFRFYGDVPADKPRLSATARTDLYKDADQFAARMTELGLENVRQVDKHVRPQARKGTTSTSSSDDPA